MSVLPRYEEIEKATIQKREQTLMGLWRKRYAQDWFVSHGKDELYFGRKDMGISFTSIVGFTAIVHVKLNKYNIRLYGPPHNWVDDKTTKHPDLALDAVARWLLQGVV